MPVKGRNLLITNLTINKKHMLKIKNVKKLFSAVIIFVFTASLVPVGASSISAEEAAVSAENSMLHFVMQVRWGNVIGEPENTDEINFDGSVSVSENARVSLQRTLLFEEHNAAADKITSKKDPVSWKSLIYNHWDGVKVTVSSPATDNVTITTARGNVVKTAQELYNMTEQYIQDVGNGKEIVIDVYPAQKNPSYFLKIFWGKIDRQEYNEKRCAAGTEGTKKCLLPLLNADGSFKIDSGGTLKLIKPLRFESPDAIKSSSDSQIEWTSRLYGGVDGILVNLRLNVAELDSSDTVTINFTSHQDSFPKSYSILDLYHNGYTEDIIASGYGVAFQVWRKANRQLIRVKDKPTVYMVEDGVKEPIPSEEVLASQGLTFGDVEVVEQEEADTYADGGAINYADGTIVQEEGTPEVYVIENGEKKHIQDPTAFTGLGYNWGNIVKVKAGILGLYGNGNPLKANSIHPEGALIRVEGNPKVYVVEGGKRVPISDIQLFNARKYDWNKVLVVNENQTQKFEIGTSLEYPDGSLLRAKNGNVYRINQGKKQWIRSADDFIKAGYKSEKVLDVSDAEINTFEDGIDVVADDVAE